MPTITTTISATITQNAAWVSKPGNSTFMPKMPEISVSGSSDDAEDREHAEDVVLAVRDDRLVRRLEAVDDLLVVVELVPDPLGRVDDVVEVEVELLGQELVHPALEHAQRRAARLHDLAVRDDLLLRVRDVADDVLGVALEHVVLDRVELVADLVEDREAVVEEVVEHLVEEPAGALGEQLLAERLVASRSGRRGA